MVSPEHENATIEVGTAGPATSQREQVLECLLKEGGRSSPGPPVTFPRARIFIGVFGGPGRYSTLSLGPV